MQKLTLAIVCLLAAPATRLLAAPPNIILILTDDQGWSQMSTPMDPRNSLSKSDYLETPNMARLADGGMRFTSGYSPAPLCTPTRRSILHGATAARSGSEFPSPSWIPADYLTIPKALKQANPDYRCAHFGKWGEQMTSTPEESGYDASHGMTGNNTGGMPSSLGVKGGHNDGPPHFIDNKDPKLTDHITDSAIRFMRAQHGAGRPFYIQASYYAQHLSVVTRQKMLEKYQRKGEPDRGYTQAWAAMMEELDTGVGRILDELDALGIADNTYVFFTADNGGRGTVPGGNNNAAPPNIPLKGAKHSLDEGGIRVPFLAKGPGVTPGSQTDVPVVGYDFLPTFVDLAGGKSAPGALAETVDGVSFKPLLTDPDSRDFKRPGGAVFFHRPRRGASVIRRGDLKLMLNWNKQGKIAGRELYDLAKDLAETIDLAPQNAALADDLQKQLLAHLKKVNAETVQNAGKRRIIASPE
ncbi:MAG: sulfatase [Planctomycetota bacterium]|jgi:arylsulfatase A-like enzyme